MRVKAALACLAAACAIVAAAWPGTVAAVQSVMCQPGPGPAGAGGVNVYRSDGSVRWCSPNDILQNSDIPPGTQLRLQTAPGNATTDSLSHAMSVNLLLSAAGVSPAAIIAVEVSRNSGSWSVLRHGALQKPSSRFENGLLPVVETQGSTTTYLRPLRNSNDPNQLDAYTTSNGAALDIYVDRGPRLIVSCAVTHTVFKNTSSTPPGKPVTFQAGVQNPGVGGGALTYHWSFGDGEGVIAGSTVTHSFAHGGTTPSTYVWVTAPNGSAGVCDGQQLNVKRKVNVPPVPSGKKNPSNGGNGSGNGNGSGTGSGNGSGGGTNPNTDTNTTTTPTTSTSTTPSQGHRTTPSGGSSSHGRTGTTPPVGSSAGQGGGKIVTGRLISAVTPVSPAQLASGNVPPPTPVNERVTPAAAVDNSSVKPIAGIVGGCAVVLLLLSGAGRELQSLRRSIASARLG